jgi:hypothetical protein
MGKNSLSNECKRCDTIGSLDTNNQLYVLKESGELVRDAFVYFLQTVYSPDIHPFRFASALSPDCSICMDCRNCPGLFQIPGFCFAKDAIVLYKYFLTNLVIIINPALVFLGNVKIW